MTVNRKVIVKFKRPGKTDWEQQEFDDFQQHSIDLTEVSDPWGHMVWFGKRELRELDSGSSSLG